MVRVVVAHSRWFFVLLSALHGCASPQFESDPSATPVVPLSKVIGSLKCGFAQAIFRDEGGRTGLLAGVAKVTMNVNVVQGRTVGGGAGVGIPVATAGSFTPSFSFTNDQTRTTNSTIHFNIDLSAANLNVCDAEYATGHDAGFSGWIGQVVESLNETVSGAPKVSMQSYEYDSDFVVMQTVGAKGEFDIVPVKGDMSYDSSRSDIQHLNIKVDAVHVVGGRTVVVGAKPFGQISKKVQEYTTEKKPPRSTVQGKCKFQEGGRVEKGGRPFGLPAECE